MAKDLLFEIGAEEIPAGFMPNILGQLKQLAETKLNDAHLSFESIATYGTPRRLALIVKGLADTSAEISERTAFIGRVRALARICAQQYLAKREELGFPLLKGDK